MDDFFTGKSCGVRMAIDIGTELTCTVETIPAYFKSELIGLSQDEYLILKLPHIVDPQFIANCEKDENKKINVTYSFAGANLSFRSDIIGVITSPIKVMVLKHPTEVSETKKTGAG